MPAINGQPIGFGPRHALGFGFREEGSVVLSVVAGSLWEFAPLFSFSRA
jgi:hypothetical protein